MVEFLSIHVSMVIWASNFSKLMILILISRLLDLQKSRAENTQLVTTNNPVCIIRIESTTPIKSTKSLFVTNCG